VQPQYVSISDAAKFCSVSERSIHRLIASGDLTAYRPMKGTLRIDLDELKQHIAGTANKRIIRGRHLQLAT
jgi:excisionase family DNA binding protein